MAKKEITLALAAFLDSPEARALPAPPTADVRKIAQAFLTVCYDELGTKPSLLDGQDVHSAVGHLLPGHFARKDPLAEHAPAVLRCFFDHLETVQTVAHSFEIRRALEDTIPEFLATVRTGEQVHHAPARQAPVVHRAAKLGRNDPCFCGSGRKFKKCHGKGG